MKAEKQTSPQKESNQNHENSMSEAKSFTLSAAKIAMDKKAENVKILDVSEISGFTDLFFICSAQNERQVEAICESIENDAKENYRRKPLSIEGKQECRWVLMDYEDVIVHVFLDALREYYDIEQLWVSAPKIQIPAEYYGDSGGSPVK